MGLHIVIADVRDMARYGLRTLLKQVPIVDVVYEAKTSEEVKKQLASHSVDLVVVHQSLTSEMTTLSWNRFVVMAEHFDKQVFLTAIERGAHGYVMENAVRDLLQFTLQLTEREGEKVFLLNRSLSSQFSDCMNGRVVQAPDLEKLTPRERETFFLLREGMKDDDIAEQLCICPTTVRSHVANVLHKLNLTRRQLKSFPLPKDDAIRKKQFPSKE